VVWLTDAPPTLPKGKSWAYESFLHQGAASFKAPELLADDAPEHLYYTSGTTGRPKGVILTHRNVTAHAMGAIAPETVRRIISTFHCDYVQTYGLTETSPYCTVSTIKAHLRELPIERQLEIIRRTGREFITVELRVVDEKGRDIPKDDETVGEIWVRGDTVSPGYLNRPEADRDAFKDGWFRTGDLAVMDAEGYLNIVDRKKDIIISGGENIYSTEVEYVLMEHPAMLECVVIGVPDPKWGEAVKAVVVCKPGEEVAEEDLKNHVKKRLAGYKTPKTIDFVDILPKTGSGKLMKRTVREWYWKGEKRRVH